MLFIYILSSRLFNSLDRSYLHFIYMGKTKTKHSDFTKLANQWLLKVSKNKAQITRDCKTFALFSHIPDTPDLSSDYQRFLKTKTIPITKFSLQALHKRLQLIQRIRFADIRTQFPKYSEPIFTNHFNRLINHTATYQAPKASFSSFCQLQAKTDAASQLPVNHPEKPPLASKSIAFRLQQTLHNLNFPSALNTLSSNSRVSIPSYDNNSSLPPKLQSPTYILSGSPSIVTPNITHPPQNHFETLLNHRFL